MTMFKNYKIILTLLFFTFCGPASAQHKRELSVHSGFIFSLSDLRSRPYNQDKLFSTDDWGLAAQFNYQVVSNFYLSAKGNVSFLKTKQDGIEEAFNKYKIENWDGGKYKLYNVLVGPKYYMPVNDKIGINYALMGGIGILNVSDIEMIIDPSNNTKKIYRKESFKFKNTLSLEGQVECDYNISPHLSLSLNVAYFLQTFKQDYFIMVSSSYNIPSEGGETYGNEMQANVFFPSIGIKYTFGYQEPGM